MKIHFLGTCAGTEPMPDRKHISHTHMDHVGGLGNLLWNIRKLTIVRKQQPVQGAVEVYMPNLESWKGLMLLLRNTEGNFETDYPVTAVQVEEGVLFDDGVLRVTAIENHHMARWQTDRCLSYSYLIECEGKRLVYSGDVAGYQDLNAFMKEGCDGLVIETGHFDIEDARNYLADKQVRRIFFSHNGREILRSPDTARNKVEQYFSGKAVICEDGMTVEL